MSNTRVVNGPGFKVCFEDEPGYLRAFVFDGEDSLPVSVAMWNLLGAECRATSVTQMLVLEELVSTVEVGEISQVVDAMFAAGLAGVRLAFVELREDIQGSELGESMCLERGLVTRIFSNETEARHWLLYGA